MANIPVSWMQSKSNNATCSPFLRSIRFEISCQRFLTEIQMGRQNNLNNRFMPLREGVEPTMMDKNQATIRPKLPEQKRTNQKRYE